jgi:membrane-bound lytic murein transglycosylase D
MDVRLKKQDWKKLALLQAMSAFVALSFISLLGIKTEIAVNFNNSSQAAEIGPLLEDNLATEEQEEVLFETLIDDSPVQSLDDYYKFHKEIAINDFYDSIKKDFKVEKNLKSRVSFWFDVYAKYGSQHHIIHHQKYPWIVFDVVDTSEIESNKRLHRWTRYHKAKALVNKRRRLIRNTLTKLSKRRNYRNLSSIELKLLKIMRKAPGKFRSRLKLASKNVRSQLGQKDFFRAGLGRYDLWITEIEKTFSKYRLPLELTRLPFVESSFNPDAVSKVGASGVWQIMPAIGKKFLKINKHIDERNDPIKSARAAALLLKENKLLLKKWPLAVTAYNTGVGLIRKGVRRHKTRDLNRLIKKYKSGNFGFAAKNFYSSFLAALHVEAYKDMFFDLENKKQFWADREEESNKSQL